MPAETQSTTPINPLQQAINRYYDAYGPIITTTTDSGYLSVKAEAKVDSQIGKIVLIKKSTYNPDSSNCIGKIGIIDDMTSNASHYYVTVPGVIQKGIFYSRDTEFVDFKKYFPNKKLFVTSDYLKFDKENRKFLISPIKSEVAFPVGFNSIANTVDIVNILAEIEGLVKDNKGLADKVRKLKEALCL